MAAGRLTIFARIEVDHITNPNIDNPQESLILLLKLLLIKHLDREYTILRRTPTASSANETTQQTPPGTDDNTHISNVSFQYGFSVRLITDVVFVCSPLSVATAKGSGNPKNQQKSVSPHTRERGSEESTTYGTPRAYTIHQQQ